MLCMSFRISTGQRDGGVFPTSDTPPSLFILRCKIDKRDGCEMFFLIQRDWIENNRVYKK